MTDKTLDDAAKALSSDTIDNATFRLGGEEYPMVVKDISIDEMEERLEAEADAEDELEAKRRLVADYLVEPDVELDTARKIGAVFAGMIKAWQGGDDMREAMDEMHVPDQGN